MHTYMHTYVKRLRVRLRFDPVSMHTDVLRFVGMAGGPKTGRYVEFSIKRIV